MKKIENALSLYSFVKLPIDPLNTKTIQIFLNRNMVKGSVFAVLRRVCHGTFHHFSKKHLDRYVNEFSFRLIEGNCEIDTMDRIKALCGGTVNKHLTYQRLITNE